MAFNDYTNYDSSYYYGRGLIKNTGTISVDTDSSSLNTISSSAVGSSIINGPYVVTASGITNYNYQPADWKSKRTDVRDNGKIPVDIWAMMYNNGVIDD